MKVKSIVCPNCGATVDLDYNNLQKFCGQCGAKLLLDIESVEALMIEREKTKQIELKEETKRIKMQAEENQKLREQEIHRKRIHFRLYFFMTWVLAMLLTAILGYNHFWGITTEFSWTLLSVLLFVGATYILYLVYSKIESVIAIWIYLAFVWLDVTLYIIAGGYYNFFRAEDLFHNLILLWIILSLFTLSLIIAFTQKE